MREKVSQKGKSAVRNKMAQEHVGGNAVRCNCLAGSELNKEDEM